MQKEQTIFLQNFSLRLENHSRNLSSVLLSPSTEGNFWWIRSFIWRKWSVLFWSSTFVSENFWSSFMILFMLHAVTIYFRLVVKHPRLICSNEAPQEVWISLTGLDYVFYSYDPMLLFAHLCGTNSTWIFLFPKLLWSIWHCFSPLMCSWSVISFQVIWWSLDTNYSTVLAVIRFCVCWWLPTPWISLKVFTSAYRIKVNASKES